MERDLLAAGYTFDDLSTRMPLSGLAAFVLYAPPGTALFHQLNEGWTVTDHLQAHAIDALHMLVWAKTTDAQEKFPKHRPDPIPRPGMVKPVTEEWRMTVEDYERLIAEGD